MKKSEVIEKLKKNEISIYVDINKFDFLQEIMSTAFPEDKILVTNVFKGVGRYCYYYDTNIWGCGFTNIENLPLINLSDIKLDEISEWSCIGGEKLKVLVKKLEDKKIINISWWNGDAKNCYYSFKNGYLNKTNEKAPYIRYSVQELENYYFPKQNKEMKKVIGYKLLKDLPDLSKGSLFKYNKDSYQWESLNLFIHYSEEVISTSTEWFEPIYEDEKIELKVGDKQQLVIIKKDQIIADAKNWRYADLLNLYTKLPHFSRISGYSIWIPNVKIGCLTITIEELEKILIEYCKINNIDSPITSF